jgi:hypothetical protein
MHLVGYCAGVKYVKTVVYLFSIFVSCQVLASIKNYHPLKDTLYDVIWATEMGHKVTISCTRGFAKIEIYPSLSGLGLADVYIKIKAKNVDHVTGGDYVRFMSDMTSWKENEIYFYGEDAVSMNNPFEGLSLAYDNFFKGVTLSYGYQGSAYLDNVIRFCEYNVEQL